MTNDPSIFLSVIVPWSRTLERSAPLLQSLQAQDLDPRKWELLIIANGPLAHGLSAEAWQKALSGLPAKVIPHSPAGANEARHRGIVEATANQLLFLDDDIELVHAETLSTLCRMWEATSKNGSFLFGRYQGHTRNLWAQTYDHVSTQWMLLQDFAPAGFLSFRKEILTQTDPFPRDLSFGGTELGLNLQIHQRGWSKTTHEHFQVNHHLGALPWSEFASKALLQGRTHKKMKSQDPNHPLLAADPTPRPRSLLIGISFFKALFWWGEFLPEPWVKFLAKRPLLNFGLALPAMIANLVLELARATIRLRRASKKQR